jgi:hypothetical protein
VQYYLYIFFLLTLALLPHVGIGSALYKKNIISGSIISMLILTSIVSPIAYINAMHIKAIIFIYFCIGLYFLFKNRKAIFKFNKNEILFFVIFSLFFLWYFRSLSPDLYIYSDHDLLYFSWISEFINPSIEGPLRLEISWPNQMASNHLIPGGIIAISSILIKKINLISSITLRYLIISLYFSYFFSHWAIIKKINPFKILIFLILGMSIFGQEIGYEIKISSFIYVILMLEILKNLYIKQNKQILFCLSLFLIIAKAPIFFVAVIFSFWIAYFSKEKISNLNWIVIILIGLNIASWFLVPRPTEHAGMPFLINIFKIEDILSLNGIKGWFITDAVSEIIFSFLEGPFITFALLIYIMTKYYLPYFLITKKIALARDKTKIILLDAWVLCSIVAWTFIRYPIGIGHTAHLYLLMAVVTLFFIIKYFSESNDYYSIIIFLLIATLFGYPHRIFNPLHYVEKELLTTPESTMTTSELKFGFTNYKNDESYAIKNQIVSAMIGEKIDAALVKPPQKSIIYNWIIQPDDK